MPDLVTIQRVREIREAAQAKEALGQGSAWSRVYERALNADHGSMNARRSTESPAPEVARPLQARPMRTDETFRVVLWIDWSSATVPFAILRAFPRFFGAQAPVKLVFALPNEPTENDYECLRALTGSVKGVSQESIILEARVLAQQLPAEIVLMLTQEKDLNTLSVAEFFVELHELSMRLSGSSNQ